MEKEIEIIGEIYLSGEASPDDFEDTFLEFVENHQWSFGGGFEYKLPRTYIKIQGCLSIRETTTIKEVETQVNTLAQTQNWQMNCQFKEIINGYYINKDGTKGKHVFDQE